MQIIQELVDTTSMFSRDEIELFCRESVEIRETCLCLIAIHLIDGIENRLMDLSEYIRYLKICRHKSLSAVHQEDDDICLIDSRVGLSPHLGQYGICGLRFE